MRKISKVGSGEINVVVGIMEAVKTWYMVWQGKEGKMGRK